MKTSTISAELREQCLNFFQSAESAGSVLLWINTPADNPSRQLRAQAALECWRLLCNARHPITYYLADDQLISLDDQVTDCLATMVRTLARVADIEEIKEVQPISATDAGQIITLEKKLQAQPIYCFYGPATINQYA